jgi:hypothetical protein
MDLSKRKDICDNKEKDKRNNGNGGVWNEGSNNTLFVNAKSI